MYGLSDKIVEEIRNISIKNNIKIVILGSRARGNYKPTSDIDIAVVQNVTTEQKYKIMDDVDKINCEYKIDLVFVQNIKNKELLKSIEEDGIEIWKEWEKDMKITKKL